MKKQSDNLLKKDEIYKLVDLYFKRKYIMYSHLHNSFDKFIDDDIKNLFEKGNNIFFEKLTKDKKYTYRFEYSDISMKPPMIDGEDEMMFPHNARTRSLTYSARLVATVKQMQDITDIATDKVTTRMIGKPEYEYTLATLPIMVRSKYCSLNIKKNYDILEDDNDPGGYFIINGSEKVIMSLERMIDNKCLVFSKKDSNVLTYYAKIHSKSQSNDMLQIVTIRMKKDNSLIIKVPIIKEVPVFILMRALGIESDRDIINYVVYNMNDTEMINLVEDSLSNSIPDGYNKKILTQEDAINYLINQMRVLKKYKYNETDKDLKIQEKKLHLQTLLKDSFLPHITGDLIDKGYYLGYMIHRLLLCKLGRISVDDRDNFVNKRIELPGPLLLELVTQAKKKQTNDCNKFFRKRNTDDNNPLNIINHIKPNIIEQPLKTSLSTGQWGKRKGVAQMLERTSFVQTLSSFRRINSPTVDASTNKLTSPRHLHPSQIGFVCYVETPEGHKVGLVKNLALMGNITIEMPSQIYILKSIIKDHIENIRDVPKHRIKDYTRVFLNGEWLGLTNQPRKLYNLLKKKKLSGDIDRNNSIIHEIKSDIESKELKVYCDGGRLFRPMLRVENNKLLLTREILDRISIDDTKNPAKINNWNDFMVKNPGVVEYIDADEQANSMLSVDQKDVMNMRNRMISSIDKMKNVKIDSNYTIVNRYDDFSYNKYNFCEIDPSMTLGLVVSNIPFLTCNQSPRNMYQYSQARQAQGIYNTIFMDRLDISYILYHPQKPVVITRNMKYIGTDKLPAGENVIVAIQCYTGYNQEDSVILNQSALDRGLFRSMKLKKYSEKIQKNQSTSQDDVFVKPDPSKVIGMRHGKYDKLNEKGFVPKETVIEKGDILIGKISPINPVGDSDKTFKDNSEPYKENTPGVVDMVYDGVRNHEGYPMIKMRIRSERKPQIGDKFCCYSPDHDVLTFDGWKSIDEITMEDKVATLMNGNTLEYHHPTAIQEYDYEGDMYVVESNQVNLRVTPNHRMYVSTRTSKFKVELAKDILHKRRKYLKNVDNINIDKEDVPRELVLDDNGEVTKFVIYNYEDPDEIEFEFDIDPWLTYFGIWMAEGSLCANRKSASISAHKQRVKDAITPCIDKLGFNKFGKYRDRKNAQEKNIYVINHNQFAKYFWQFGKSINKYLPEWVWYLNMEQCQKLIDSMVLGDGHYMKGTTTIRYDTSSKQLANDFQRLCLHAGYSANSRLKYKAGHTSTYEMCEGEKLDEPRTITSTVDSYRLTIVKKQNQPLVNKNIKTDKSNALDKLEPGYKGKVYCCSVPGEGIIYIRRRSRENWCPEWCGNSRSGQKGTCGLTLSQADMPFTAEGLTPDLIMNPHAIPSRMTMSQLIECLLGKVAANEGKIADGSPFEEINIEAIEAELEKRGYIGTGVEYLYNGMTGKKIKCAIFIGPTYYQRLKHMVEDKKHSRSIGPRTILTRQPPEGRSRDGGLRFGEMERDCCAANGIAIFLKERMVEVSDGYIVHVCEECGLLAQRMMRKDNLSYSTKEDIYHCPSCRNKTNIAKTKVPYAFKLFLQEMMSMSVAPRIKFDTNKYIS